MTWPDVLVILQRTLTFITDGTVHNGDGDEIPLNAQGIYDAARTTPHTQLCATSASAPFRSFQLFVCVDNDAPFMELTFFPDDIVERDDPLPAVVRFLNHLCDGTSVSNYFVRYENVSWVSGDTGPNSGVIFTKHDVATVA